MDYRHVISEEARIKTLRRLVDDCAHRLASENITETEAQELIEAVRKKVLGLFSGKEDQFELIYRPRFERIIREKIR